MAKDDPATKIVTDDSGRRKQPTLKTIAALTGLAVPTISRALSGAEDISKATRARVRAVADEIGYVPNRAGVRLRTGRTNVISLILSTEHEVMNHTARLISGVAGGLRNTPFHLNITPFFPEEDPLKPVRHIVETRSADAVIFNQIKPEDPRVAFLRRVNFPFATHGRTIWADSHPYYDFDNGAFGNVSIRALAARGRKRVLLIAPPPEHNYGRLMIEGAKAGGAATGVHVDVLDGATSDHSIADTERAIDAFFAAGNQIDGVVCASNSSSIAAMSVLEARGLVIGETADLLTKEAIPLIARIRPATITVNEDVGRCGGFLARAAMQAILSPEKKPMQFLDTPVFDGQNVV